jgi:hypothetical protein
LAGELELHHENFEKGAVMSLSYQTIERQAQLYAIRNGYTNIQITSSEQNETIWHVYMMGSDQRQYKRVRLCIEMTMNVEGTTAEVTALEVI